MFHVYSAEELVAQEVAQMVAQAPSVSPLSAVIGNDHHGLYSVSLRTSRPAVFQATGPEVIHIYPAGDGLPDHDRPCPGA